MKQDAVVVYRHTLVASALEEKSMQTPRPRTEDLSDTQLGVEPRNAKEWSTFGDESDLLGTLV